MEKGFEEKVLAKLELLEVKVAVIESKINDDLKATKDKADDAFILAKDAYSLATQNKEDLKELKEKHKWLVRTVAAAIITALVGWLMSFIKFK